MWRAIQRYGLSLNKSGSGVKFVSIQSWLCQRTPGLSSALMIVTRTDAAAFTAEFESEEELRNEQQTNLSVGGLRLLTSEKVPPQSALTVTLRGPSGSEVAVKATVVAQLPDGIALVIDGDSDAIVKKLLAAPADDQGTSWDRMRRLSQTEKILLAVKADRSERAVLVQDNDPRVLLSVLRNPRLTIDCASRSRRSSTFRSST